MAPPFAILCVGGAVIDRTYLCTHKPQLGTSNPVARRCSYGGVARNVSEVLARLGAAVGLVSAVGDDEAGRALLSETAAAGVDVSHVFAVRGSATAEYTAAFWQGELFAGFADMDVLDSLMPEVVAPCLPIGGEAAAPLVLADCNLPAETLGFLIAEARRHRFRLCLDCVSVAKSERLPVPLDGIEILFLNAAQAHRITGEEGANAALDRILARGCASAVLTRGPDGLVVARSAARIELPAPKVKIVNVSGAGDALVAGTLLGLSEGRELVASVLLGLAAAAFTLQSPGTVSSDLSRAKLERMAAQLTPID
jgi:pseudouridine kinase